MKPQIETVSPAAPQIAKLGAQFVRQNTACDVGNGRNQEGNARQAGLERAEVACFLEDRKGTTPDTAKHPSVAKVNGAQIPEVPCEGFAAMERFA